MFEQSPWTLPSWCADHPGAPPGDGARGFCRAEAGADDEGPDEFDEDDFDDDFDDDFEQDFDDEYDDLDFDEEEAEEEEIEAEEEVVEGPAEFGEEGDEGEAIDPFVEPDEFGEDEGFEE